MKKQKWFLSLIMLVVFCLAGTLAACDGSVKQLAKPSNLTFSETEKTVSWNAVEGADSYTYEVTHAGGETADLQNANLTETSFSVATLAAGSYTAKVRANAVGDNKESEWATLNFTIAGELVKLATPTDLERHGDMITWTTVENASAGYTLTVYDAATNLIIVAFTVINQSANPYYMMQSVQFSNKDYYMELVANKVDGSYAESESAKVKFSSCGKAPLATPANVRKTGLNTIEWDAVADALTYTVEVRNAATGELLNKAGASAISGTTFALTDNSLESNVQYLIRVYADQNTAKGDGSAAGTTTVTLPQRLPDLTGFYSEYDEDGTMFAWNAVDGASNGYRLEIYNENDALVEAYDTTSLSQLVSRQDVPVGTYYAVVYAKEITTDGAQRMASKSMREDFEQSGPILATPQNVKYDKTTRKITWTGVDSAEKYHVKMTFIDTEELIVDKDVTGTEVDLSSKTLPGGSYKIEVVAKAAGYSDSRKAEAAFSHFEWNFDIESDMDRVGVGVSNMNSEQGAVVRWDEDNGRLEVKKGPSGQMSSDGKEVLKGHVFRFRLDVPKGATVKINLTFGGNPSVMPFIYGMNEAGENKFEGFREILLQNGENTLVATEETHGIWFMINHHFKDDQEYLMHEGDLFLYVNSISMELPKAEQDDLIVTGSNSVVYGAEPVQLFVTGGSSGEQVHYSIISGPAAVTENGLVSFTGAGTVKVKVTMPGNEDYAAISAEYVITVAQKELTLTGVTAVNRAYNGETAVALTGGTLSGTVGNDDVSFQLNGGTIASANAGTGIAVTLNTITLTGAQKNNYALKQPEYAVTVDIAKAEQAAPVLKYTRILNGVTVTPVANAEYKLEKADGTLVKDWSADNTFTDLEHVEYKVYIRFPADDNHNAAESSATVTIGKADQDELVLAGDVADLTYGDGSVQLSVTGGSTNGDVTYLLVAGPAEVSEDGLVTILGAGEIQIKATMAGDDQYDEVFDVITFTVAKAEITKPVKLHVDQENKLLSWTAEGDVNGFHVTVEKVVGTKVTLVKDYNTTVGATSQSMQDVVFETISLLQKPSYRFTVVAKGNENYQDSEAAVLEIADWSVISFEHSYDRLYFADTADTAKTEIDTTNGGRLVIKKGDKDNLGHVARFKTALPAGSVVTVKGSHVSGAEPYLYLLTKDGGTEVETNFSNGNKTFYLTKDYAGLFFMINGNANFAVGEAMQYIDEIIITKPKQSVNFDQKSDCNFLAMGASILNPDEGAAFVWDADNSRVAVRKGELKLGHKFTFWMPVPSGATVTINITKGEEIHPFVYGLGDEFYLTPNTGFAQIELSDGNNVLTASGATSGIGFMVNHPDSLSAGDVFMYINSITVTLP